MNDILERRFPLYTDTAYVIHEYLGSEGSAVSVIRKIKDPYQMMCLWLCSLGVYKKLCSAVNIAQCFAPNLQPRTSESRKGAGQFYSCYQE